MTPIRRRGRWLALACALGALGAAACGDDDGDNATVPSATTAAANAGGRVKASASFEVTLGDESGSFDYTQSKIVPSLLDWTPQVPVALHAADAENVLDEFTLSGRVEEGEQETSEAVVLGLGVTLDPSSALFISDDGTCTVTVDELSDTRISGSFTCDAEYGDEPLHAEGTFEARSS